MLPILGKPTIEMVILRAKQVNNVDAIIVCTTNRPIDDEIVQIAEKCGVLHYRGSLDDKLERWLGAATNFGIDCFVTMDGDDLLCDPELMEAGLKQLTSSSVDFVEAPPGLICGSFTYGIRTTALEKVCSIKDTSDTEMMWVYFKDTGLFEVSVLKVDDPVYYDSNIRMTLDYEEDLAFFQAIFEFYNCVNNDVPLREIVPYLKMHSAIIELNTFRHHDWASNQQKKTKLILKNG
jgi:spore coat polysaccharide biosynthesis protein SpsF